MRRRAGIAAVVAVGLSLMVAGCGTTQPVGSSGPAPTSLSAPTTDVMQDLNSALSSAANADADANSAQQAANTADSP